MMIANAWWNRLQSKTVITMQCSKVPAFSGAFPRFSLIYNPLRHKIPPQSIYCPGKASNRRARIGAREVLEVEGLSEAVGARLPLHQMTRKCREGMSSTQCRCWKEFVLTLIIPYNLSQATERTRGNRDCKLHEVFFRLLLSVWSDDQLFFK